MPTAIVLNADQINTLDLSPATTLVTSWQAAQRTTDHAQSVSFEIDFPRDANDPRELSEIPEIRLWFVRLDALYPWFPYLLDWKAGELARYTAMLVPHQFHPREGIQYNPEALEIFVMHKIFVLTAWLRSQGIDGRSSLKNMAQMFGYELEDGLFDVLDSTQ